MLPIDEQMMLKYIQGECSVEEKNMFIEWLSLSDENRECFYQTKAMWNLRNIKHFSTEELLNKAEGVLNRNINLLELHRKKKLHLRLLKYAAIFVIALAIPIVLYTAISKIHANADLITVVVSKTDSTKLVTLSDGSQIWLNNNSSLTYPAKFTKGQRYVTFIGEGYFEIKHDALHPFVVQTKNIQVKVLGTSFNVRAYPSERKTETTLVKGKVVIQNKKGNNLALLVPGQMAAFDKTNHYLSVEEVDTTLCASWRYGVIVFTNATINEITNKLSELYNVHFEYDASKVGTTTYNFNFQKSQSINKVMDMLCFIAPLDYQVHEKKIVIMDKE